MVCPDVISRPISTRRGGLWHLRRPMPSLPSGSRRSWRCTGERSSDGSEFHRAAEPGSGERKEQHQHMVTLERRTPSGRPTLDSSSPVMHPVTSVLLANTSRLAPESRLPIQSAQLARGCGHRASGLSHLFLEKAVQLLPAVVDTQPVGGVDHPDQRIRLLKVVAPVRPQRLLAADVPYGLSDPGRPQVTRSSAKAYKC